MEEPSQRLPQFVTVGFGVLGAACFACVLVPQALLNARRRSTEGMSVGLVVLWHVSVLLSASYYAAPFLANASGDAEGEGSSVWAVLSIFLFGLVSCFVEAQALAYRPRVDGAVPKRGPMFVLAAGTTLLTAVFISLCVALTWIFSMLPHEAAYILGNMVTCALLALGFVPQLWEFVASRSIEGYSFGVTVNDIIGCLSNIIVLFAPTDVGMGEVLKEAMPFVTIVTMHFGLIAVAVWVTLVGSRGSAPSGNGKAVDEGPREDSAAEFPSTVTHGGGKACDDSPIGGQHV